MSDQLSIIDLIINASLLVQLVMILLVMMSLYSWTIIFSKRKNINVLNRDILQFDFNIDKGLNSLYQTAINVDKKKLIEQVFIDGIDEAREVSSSKTSDKKLFETSAKRAKEKMQVTLGRELELLSKGISSLAMIGSISPFIGLFGTVWGIMHSFIGLTAVKQATIAVVAPGIAEALIATAIGLFVAIPATMSYNTFMTKIDNIYQLHESYIEEIYIVLQRR
jgi:biopolymer transport protein TolQ